MDFFEALVAITAIVVGCWTLVQVLQLGGRAFRRLFGATPAGGEAGDSLRAGEVEDMIRRAVREEVRQEVQPLQNKIERLERRDTREKAPRRDLPEDPHDFGLIAEAHGEQEEHAA
jgi:hypothetical protein